MSCAPCFCAQCGNVACRACQRCLLVAYCNRECQKSDWPRHKEDCKSPLAERQWEPGWVTEDRKPTFVDDKPFITFGGKKYYWGNMPALDVLQLSKNEGASYGSDLRLLFAASGDLRDIVETIKCLPQEYKRTITIHMNDRDFDIVARNLIITLLALVAPAEPQAVDCMLHVWYSAMVTAAHLEYVRVHLRPLISDVIRKIEERSAHTILGKTWSFPTGSCRVELTKVQWNSLLSLLESPPNLSAERAAEFRKAITLAPERLDHLHRHLYAQKPVHRLCLLKFRQDGLLLPFGHSRKLFVMPNPTFYHSKTWPMKDSADPLAGWSYSDVLSVSTGPTVNDLYGKLHAFVRERLFAFQKRLCIQGCEFTFTNIDARDLSERSEARFSRIETSNIADAGYLGMVQTAMSLSPLLNLPAENPHATLICLFLNAVDETERTSGDMKMQMRDMTRAMRFFTAAGKLKSRYDAKVVLSTAAKDYVRDGDYYFNEYMRNADFDFVIRSRCLELKEQHTIVDKWPLKLRLEPDDSGAQHEFDTLQASMHSGCERYAEWRKPLAE